MSHIDDLDSTGSLPRGPELGVIEGRFGRPWSWEDRTRVMKTLAGAGYRFYHYGPKADRHLRREYRTPHPPAEFDALCRFANACREHGVRFGTALTPMDAIKFSDSALRGSLADRVRTLAQTGLDDFAILFDDLRGDLPGLIEAQVDVVHFCADMLPDARIFLCPTYYSDDPVLDRVFGERPPNYLDRLGRLLDPSIRVYWTGEEVCSREITAGHLRSVAERLGRPVCLWDNYPVNDGARMSRFLHLRAFTGRSDRLTPWLSGHAINPAIQPLLTCLPALTLPRLYAEGDAYCYGAALGDAARSMFGNELAAMIEADLLTFVDSGWERIGDRRASLARRYAAIDHPAAREITHWLEGADLMTDEEVRTQ